MASERDSDSPYIVDFHAVIDRFESSGEESVATWAVLEFPEKVMVEIPAAQLPPSAAEGDWVKIRISVDRDRTDEARSEIEELQRRLADRS